MILVRHATSVVDPTSPAAEWSLATDALDDVAALRPHITATRVVASTERKAVRTAEALALGAVDTFAAFSEVRRPFYDSGDDLRRAIAVWFGGAAVDGWEPRKEAVGRFDAEVQRLGAEGLAVVTHGTVMTAWLQSLGLVEDAMAFWSGLRMPDAWDLSPTLTRCLPPS